MKNGYVKNLKVNFSVIKYKILKREQIFGTAINKDVLWNKTDSD